MKMNKISTTALTLAMFLTFATPALAAPTWIPSYEQGKQSYVSPELNLPSLQNELVKASEPHGIKFISIATIKGDDLPDKGYARVVNDKFIANYGIELGSKYVTMVFVRDTNPLKGSFSINAGSDLRSTFSASVLNEFQKPILKRFMPQDPNGAMVTVSNGLNEKISSQEATNSFAIGLIMISIAGGLIYLILTLTVNALQSIRELAEGWKKIDEKIKNAANSYSTIADEIKFFDMNLVTSDKKKTFELVKERMISVGDMIEHIYSTKERLTEKSSKNLYHLNSLVDKVVKTLNDVSNDLEYIKNPSSYRTTYTTPKASKSINIPPVSKNTYTSSTTKSTPSRSSNNVVIIEENNYYSGSGSSSGSSSDYSSSSSSSYDWGSSSSSSDSSSYDSGSSSSDYSSSDSSSSDW
jgi:hypothetical protein